MSGVLLEFLKNNNEIKDCFSELIALRLTFFFEYFLQNCFRHSDVTKEVKLFWSLSFAVIKMLIYFVTIM